MSQALTLLRDVPVRVEGSALTGKEVSSDFRGAMPVLPAEKTHPFTSLSSY